MRRMITTMAAIALAFGAVVGVTGSAAAQEEEISAWQCLLGGGLPLPIGENESLVCLGGVHDGAPVKNPQAPQG